MNLIELHIIQSFPVTCLNRDDLGSPKSAVFGGVPRARVSSQCWKRAIRFEAKESPSAALFAGERSRLVGPAVEDAALKIGLDSDSAKAYAKFVCELLGKDGKSEGLVKTLLYFSPATFENVVKLIRDTGKIVPEIVSKINDGDEKIAAKALGALVKDRDLSRTLKGLGESVLDAADIALFGRMVADDASQTVEGAAMFSHALSTHAVRNDIDFFSAVDDAKKGEEDDAGAGHIGTTEFNSACYYRYVGINIDLLKESKLFDQKELKAVLETFIRACVMANPVARRNAMFGYTLPSCVLGLRRQGQPLSLANAFESPVTTKRGLGVVEVSVAALKGEWESLQKTFGVSAAKAVSVEKGGATLDDLLAGMLEGVA